MIEQNKEKCPDVECGKDGWYCLSCREANPTPSTLRKRLVERIEVIINRHSPMPNFETKELCATEIYDQVLEQEVGRARLERHDHETEEYISSLISLGSKNAEIAYERGKKEGYDKGYLDGRRGLLHGGEPNYLKLDKDL